MKVKLLVSRAGADFVQNRGDVVDVSTDEAKRMFEASPPQAIPVRDEDDVETADKPARGRGKKG